MSAEHAHPDEHPEPDGDANEHGRRRNPGSPKRSHHRPRARKPAPPLWRPGEGPRDVNLEMTPEDLDRSPDARPQGAAREHRHRGPQDEVDYREPLGLGRSLRERFMPPAK